MYLLIVREKGKEGAVAEILDVKIVPEKEFDRYAQRAAELNKTNRHRNYAIEKYEDGSLVTFLALDRQYDIDKYIALANIIRKDLSALLERLDLLGLYFKEATSTEK